MKAHYYITSGPSTLISFMRLLAYGWHMEEMTYDIELVSIDLLKGHEEVIPDNVSKRVRKLEKKGFYKPIIVDRGTFVILDGHHKCRAAQKLELSFVPVILVDYRNDDSVIVEVWPDCGKNSITKNEVIEMGISESLFGPKTSRHLFQFELPKISIPLSKLR